MTPLQGLLLQLQRLLWEMRRVDRRVHDVFLAILTVRVAGENARRLGREEPPA